MNTQSTNDLIRIAAAGGGFKIDGAARATNDLIRIAAASAGKGKVVFTNMAASSTNDLIRIAAVGKGSVFFED